MACKRRGAFLAALAPCLLAGACRREPAFSVPPLSDEPVVAAAKLSDLVELAPGYGISVRRDNGVLFEVSVEAEDGPRIKKGRPCTAYLPPSGAPIQCQVSRIVRSASEETGQSIAWLKPKGWSGQAGEFVFARITMAARRGVLSVPKEAVLNKGGRTWVIRRERPLIGQVRFVPAEVETGAFSDTAVEIRSGLRPGDEVVVQGGLGFLYPEFKAGAED